MEQATDSLLRAGGGLDAIAALDNVCLETNRARTAVQLEEETTRVTQNGTHLVATP